MACGVREEQQHISKATPVVHGLTRGAGQRSEPWYLEPFTVISILI